MACREPLKASTLHPKQNKMNPHTRTGTMAVCADSAQAVWIQVHLDGIRSPRRVGKAEVAHKLHDEPVQCCALSRPPRGDLMTPASSVHVCLCVSMACGTRRVGHAGSGCCYVAGRLLRRSPVWHLCCTPSARVPLAPLAHHVVIQAHRPQARLLASRAILGTHPLLVRFLGWAPLLCGASGTELCGVIGHSRQG